MKRARGRQTPPSAQRPGNLRQFQPPQAPAAGAKNVLDDDDIDATTSNLQSEEEEERDAREIVKDIEERSISFSNCIKIFSEKLATVQLEHLRPGQTAVWADLDSIHEQYDARNQKFEGLIEGLEDARAKGLSLPKEATRIRGEILSLLDALRDPVHELPADLLVHLGRINSRVFGDLDGLRKLGEEHTRLLLNAELEDYKRKHPMVNLEVLKAQLNELSEQATVSGNQDDLQNLKEALLAAKADTEVLRTELRDARSDLAQERQQCAAQTEQLHNLRGCLELQQKQHEATMQTLNSQVHFTNSASRQEPESPRANLAADEDTELVLISNQVELELITKQKTLADAHHQQEKRLWEAVKAELKSEISRLLMSVTNKDDEIAVRDYSLRLASKKLEDSSAAIAERDAVVSRAEEDARRAASETEAVRAALKVRETLIVRYLRHQHGHESEGLLSTMYKLVNGYDQPAVAVDERFWKVSQPLTESSCAPSPVPTSSFERFMRLYAMLQGDLEDPARAATVFCLVEHLMRSARGGDAAGYGFTLCFPQLTKELRSKYPPNHSPFLSCLYFALRELGMLLRAMYPAAAASWEPADMSLDDVFGELEKHPLRKLDRAISSSDRKDPAAVRQALVQSATPGHPPDFHVRESGDGHKYGLLSHMGSEYFLLIDFDETKVFMWDCVLARFLRDEQGRTVVAADNPCGGSEPSIMETSPSGELYLWWVFFAVPPPAPGIAERLDARIESARRTREAVRQRMEARRAAWRGTDTAPIDDLD